MTYNFYYVSKFIVVVCQVVKGKQYRQSLHSSRFLDYYDSIISILKHMGQKFIVLQPYIKEKYILKTIISHKKSKISYKNPIKQYLMTNRKDLQQIVTYVNNLLSTYPSASDVIPINIDNCVQALHDGVILCYVVNCLSTTGEVIKESQLKKSKATLFHKMDQVNKALQAAKKVGLNLVNVRAEFIVEKKENTIIGLFNQITRQKPGPKTQLKKQVSEQKTQKPPVIEQLQPVPLKKQQSTNFIIETQPEQPKHEEPTHQQQFIPQKIVQQPPPQPPQPPKPNPKQLISKIKINQNQIISNQAKNGYNFPNAPGVQVLVLSGSLRKGSTNRGIITCLEQIKTRKYFDNMFFHVPDLGILPLFNNDLVKQGRVPKAVQDLRDITRKVNAILIATPQYNGSFSAIIKNAFDWLSSSSQNNPSPLDDKKIGITSASYLSQNQIKDIIDMGQFHRCNYFSESFYINLQSGAFNMESGKLNNQYQIDRLALWYQDFSYFVISNQAKPQPQARFIMNV